VAAAAVLLAAPTLAALGRPEAGLPAAAPEDRTLWIEPFPFQPRFTLTGYGEPVAEISAGQPSLRYTGPEDRWLTVSITRTAPAPAPGKMIKPFEVRGHAATLAAGPDRALTWQEPDGRWLRVEADAGLAITALTRYAAGLDATGSVPVRPPFVFDSIPAGLSLDTVTPAVMSFRPPEISPSDSFLGKLVVSLSPQAQAPVTAPQVDIGSLKGHVTKQPDATTVHVYLGDGRVLEIQSAAEVGLTDQALLTFAAGTHPTPDARTAAG
jgi:hypothetical protein